MKWGSKLKWISNEVWNWSEWKLGFAYHVWWWKGKKHVSTFCRERKVAFILMWFAFGDEEEKTHGYVLWRKIFFFFFFGYKGYIYFKKILVYSLHRKMCLIFVVERFGAFWNVRICGFEVANALNGFEIVALEATSVENCFGCNCWKGV
jgi:hypothetical protein